MSTNDNSENIDGINWIDPIKRVETDAKKSLLTHVADSFRVLNIPIHLSKPAHDRPLYKPSYEPKQLNKPIDSRDWLTPAQLAGSKSEPLHQLLHQIEVQSGISSRRYAAAAFLLRYGWVCSVWLAPFYVDRLIPLTSPNQLNLKYSADGYLYAFSFNSGCYAAHKESSDYRFEEERAPTKLYQTVDEGMGCITEQLLSHHKPIIDTLHRWSRYSHKALWAMCSTTWVTQLLQILRALSFQPEQIETQLTAFYRALNSITHSLPEYYHLVQSGETHYFVKNRSCCLYFKGESRHFCMNCPLIPPEERLQRNRACIEYLE